MRNRLAKRSCLLQYLGRTALVATVAYGVTSPFADAENAWAKPGDGREVTKDLGKSDRVTPAAERSIAPMSDNKVISTYQRSSRSNAPKPVLFGKNLSDEEKKNLQKNIDSRIEKNLGEIKSLRKEAIELLQGFLAEAPKDAHDLPEALLRLGELKWEEERDAYITRFAEWEKKPTDLRGVAPEPNFQPSRDLFARVLRDHPNFREMDLALYIDGFLATEQGKNDEALVRFERIIKEFPTSRFLADAHMFKGESIFASRYDYEAALKEYELVLSFKDSDLYGLAMFKSAWCLWRLGRSDEAAKRFVSVFEVADQGKGKGSKKSASEKKELDELQTEALKYLVEVFTEDDKNTANDVYGFLTKIGGDKFAVKVVRALADQFFDTAHYERGVEAYELLLKLDPTSKDAGTWMLRIAEGWNIVDNHKKLRDTYERLVRDYTQGGTWARTQGDPAVVAETEKLLEQRLREHAVNLHAKAQRDKTSRAEYEGARGLYDVYLSKFDKSEKGYLVAYYAAEIEFYHLNQNLSAATHYMMSARSISNEAAKKDPEKTMRHDAIFNAIASLERVRMAELEAKKNSKSESKEESEIDAKFAEALDLYAELYPNDPTLPELFYRQGKLYYDYNVFDSAVRIWGTLLEKFPNSPNAKQAGELLLDSFNRSKNYENIELWARRLKTVPAFQTPQQREKLDTLIVQSVFKQGEQKANSGDHKAAAAAYLRAAKEFSKDQRAAQAVVNAEVEAQKAGDLETLRAAANLITNKDYRDKPEAPQGAWIAASTFQSMGLFKDAAEYSELIASSNDRQYPHFQKYEKTKDASFNAVLLRVTTGDNDKAVQNGERFVQAYPNSPEADEVVFQIGRAHQNAGRPKQAAELYRKYIPRAKNRNHQVQGMLLLAQAEFKAGNEKAGDAALRQAADAGKRRGRELGAEGKYAAAQARYMEGERILDRFAKVEISGDVKQLSARLKEKTELLKKAATVFLDTVSMGVAEWSTASLYQIGFTYESFSKSLREAPPPAKLSAEEKEQFQSQIDAFVVPVEEKSLDAYENGWKKAMELGIYNKWTAKMRDALGRLNAELYRPLKETGFEIRQSSPSPFPPLFEAPQRDLVAAPKGKGSESNEPKKEESKSETKSAKDAKAAKESDNPYETMTPDDDKKPKKKGGR